MMFCVLHRSSYEHAEYLKKHKVFKAIGDKCRFQPYMIPSDADHIILHNNVGIGSGVLLVCHDAVHKVLNNMFDESGNPISFKNNVRRRVEDIEIYDNVQIGANVIVFPGVHIGPNAIVSAGSVVTKDVPPDSIVAGNPAQIIGSFSVMERMRRGETTAAPDETAPASEPAAEPEQETERRLLQLLSENINGIDFQKENRIVDDGLIDSLSLISILTLIEREFNCKIPYQRINADTFNSIPQMARMLSEISDSVHTVNDQTAPAAGARSGAPLNPDVRATEKPVVEQILGQAAVNPHEAAIIANDKETTYRELGDMIVSIAEWLRTRGMSSGDRVVVQAHHSDLCVACYYAVHLIGAVLVPVEKTAAGERIAQIAEDTNAKQIICLQKGVEDDRWTLFSEIDRISHNIKLSDIRDIKYPDIDQPCEMIFTTGTTGKSKGVLISHRNMSWYVYAVAKAVEMKERNRFLLTTPLNHAGGLRRTHLMLANGCCIVYLDGMSDLGRYFSYIEKYRVTSLYLPPVTIRILLTRAGDELARYKDQIDFVYSSSSPLPVGDCEALRKLLPNTRLYNAYEASETPGVSANDYNKGVFISNCLGKANEGTELGILTDGGKIVKEPRVKGRICVKSRMNMLEYDHEPELTASVMNGEWFVSSDLGYLDEDGNVYYEGREGDVINIGGYKIAPTEVEEVALLSGLCKECICIEALDEFDIPFVKLLAAPVDGRSIDTRALMNYLSERLEAYKLPRVIEQVEAVNRTFNGKIDRKSYRV